MFADRIKSFHDISLDPEGYARNWRKRTGGKVVGTLCSYAPEELILPPVLWGFVFSAAVLPFQGPMAHLQAYSCSLVRGALEDALAGRLDFIDGMVFPHTCDSIQRLSDVWRMNAGTGFHLDVVMPVKLDTDSARDYMVAVMKGCKMDLEQALGNPITDADLERAVVVYNGIREKMASLYHLRKVHPGLIPGSDVHAVVRASMVMDRGDFLQALTELVVDMEKQAGTVVEAGKRLLLAGGVCNLPDIYGLIERAGGIVVWDDLCTGARQLTGPIDTDIDLIKAIALRYACRAICPAKHRGITARGDELVGLAKAARFGA